MTRTTTTTTTTTTTRTARRASSSAPAALSGSTKCRIAEDSQRAATTVGSVSHGLRRLSESQVLGHGISQVRSRFWSGRSGVQPFHVVHTQFNSVHVTKTCANVPVISKFHAFLPGNST
eukprot:76648-Rhodomonas_salina.2